MLNSRNSHQEMSRSVRGMPLERGSVAMTVNVARRRSRSRAAPAPGVPSLAIGEIDQTIFACPACARPLALGAHKCPGCGTRLVMGVQLRRASVFTAVGLFAGLLLGAGGLFVAITLDRLGHSGDPAGQIAAAGATASQRPGSGLHGTIVAATPSAPSATATVRPTAATSDVPALSRSALGQAVALNERIGVTGTALREALGAKRFDAVAVSQLLRTMSSDAVVGLGLTPHIGAWPGGMTAAADLTTFYTAVKATAADGLSASVRNEKAYRTAANRIVDLLGGLDAVDAVVRDASTAAGVTLPAASAAP